MPVVTRFEGPHSRAASPPPTEIRPADIDDAGLLARVILMASRSHLPSGFWDLLLPGPEQDLLEFLEYLTLGLEASPCHYEHFLVAERDGEGVAAIAGFDPGQPDLVPLGLVIAAAFGELGFGDRALTSAYRRLEPYQAAVPEQHRGVWTIEWVATLPEHRRTGLISLLLDAVLERGRERGYSRAQVTTYVDNEAAARAYARFGFRPAQECRDPAFEALMGSPGLVRFERAL